MEGDRAMSAPLLTRHTESVGPAAPAPPRRKGRPGSSIWRHKTLYLMALPGIVYFLVFKYLPMGGLVIAFQDYMPFMGVTGSPWVGFDHFVRLRSEEHTSELQSRGHLVCRLLLEKKKQDIGN